MHVVEHAAQRVVGIACVAASSTASLMAMPRLPGESGVAASTARPELVWSLGLGKTSAPQVCIIMRR